MVVVSLLLLGEVSLPDPLFSLMFPLFSLLLPLSLLMSPLFSLKFRLLRPLLDPLKFHPGTFLLDTFHPGTFRLGTFRLLGPEATYHPKKE